jgi:hypothetical protein
MSKPVLILRLLIPLLIAVAAMTGYLGTERRLGILHPDQIINIDDFPQMSGMAYWSEHGTLIGVGNHQIAEISLQGRVLRKRGHAGYAFADVALLPDAERTIVVDAQVNRLVTFSLADFAIVSEKSMPQDPSLPWRKGQQYAGIAMTGVPPRVGLVLGNEYPPALVFFGADWEKQERTLLLGANSISGVISGPQGELLLVSKENGFLLLDAQGNMVGKGWRPVASSLIKSAALVPNVGLIVCEAGSPGRLLIFSSIKNWQDLLDAFKSRS